MNLVSLRLLCLGIARASSALRSACATLASALAAPSVAHYLDTALGSSYEVETQLLIANKVGYIKNENEKGVSYEDLLAGIQEIEKQLAGLIQTLREK